MSVLKSGQSWTQRIAEWLGETTPDGVRPKAPKVRSLQRYVEQHYFSSLLQYEAYDEEGGYYYNQDGLGMVFEVSPCMGASDDMLNQLMSFVNDNVPSEAIMQCFLYGSPKIYHALAHWANTRSVRGGFYQKIAEERVNYLSRSAHESLLAGKHYHLRDIRIIISVQLAGHDDRQKQQLLQLGTALMATFTAMGSHARPVDAKAFINLTRELINPNSEVIPSLVEWETSRDLSSQCVPFGHEVKVLDNELQFSQEDWVARTFSVEQLPTQWHQAQNSNLIGVDNKDFLQLKGCYGINLVFRKIPDDKAKKRILVKGARSEQMMKSPLSKVMPRMKYIAQDWQQVKEATDVNGASLVEVLLQTVVFSPKAHIDAAQEAMKAVFLSQGWRLAQDKHLCLQSFLCLLPMQVYPNLFKDLVKAKRTRTLLSMNIPHLMPLQGEWKGNASPSLLIAGRRGQIGYLDNFANQTGNYNMAVTGKSRSGKSVLLQDLSIANVGSGGRAIIFDIGRSFEKTTRLVGGEFVEFSRDSQICMNPFTRITDFDDSVAMLSIIFASMASQTRELTDVESAFLEEGLKSVWQVHGQQTTVTDVAQWLTQHDDPRAKDIGTSLYPYTAEGQYGRFFNGPCNLDFSNPYLTLELEELKSKKKLQSTVLMMLMYHVTETMYHGDRKQRILCIIDEAWDLLGGKLGGQFIETGYRRAAKYNGAFVAGTQGLGDFDKTPAGVACKENADMMIIMSQKNDTIERAEKDNTIDMTPHLKQQLKSVKTVHEQYAELCIKTEEGYSIHRFLLDDFSQACYSSKGPLHAEFLRLINDEQFAVDQAIERVAVMSQQGAFR